jgi:hypothetical protein
MTFNELEELLTEKEKDMELIFVGDGIEAGIDELIDTDEMLVRLTSNIY